MNQQDGSCKLPLDNSEKKAKKPEKIDVTKIPTPKNNEKEKDI